MTVSEEAYRDLAQACTMRAQERDKVFGDLLVEKAYSHEVRSEVARMLGVTGDGCTTPDWPLLLVRLNECLTTLRRKAA